MYYNFDKSPILIFFYLFHSNIHSYDDCLRYRLSLYVQSSCNLLGVQRILGGCAKRWKLNTSSQCPVCDGRLVIIHGLSSSIAIRHYFWIRFSIDDTIPDWCYDDVELFNNNKQRYVSFKSLNKFPELII